MARFLTRAEAMEFIETWMNLPAASSDNGNGTFSFELVGVSFDEVASDAMQFEMEAGGEICASAITITTDHTEEMPCVCVLIRTEGDHA